MAPKDNEETELGLHNLIMNPIHSFTTPRMFIAAGTVPGSGDARLSSAELACLQGAGSLVKGSEQ